MPLSFACSAVSLLIAQLSEDINHSRKSISFCLIRQVALSLGCKVLVRASHEEHQDSDHGSSVELSNAEREDGDRAPEEDKICSKYYSFGSIWTENNKCQQTETNVLILMGPQR